MITARRLRPCLLYTPPVAPTDLDGLASCPEPRAQVRDEVPRACPSGGRRSRNKAAVGEPAAGSFPSAYALHKVQNNQSSFLNGMNSTSDSGPLGSGVDEERSTERDWWRRASALCESSLFEWSGGTQRDAERHSVARTDTVCPRKQVTCPLRPGTTGRT